METIEQPHVKYYKDRHEAKFFEHDTKAQTMILLDFSGGIGNQKNDPLRVLVWNEKDLDLEKAGLQAIQPIEYNNKLKEVFILLFKPQIVPPDSISPTAPQMPVLLSESTAPPADDKISLSPEQKQYLITAINGALQKFNLQLWEYEERRNFLISEFIHTGKTEQELKNTFTFKIWELEITRLQNKVTEHTDLLEALTNEKIKTINLNP